MIPYFEEVKLAVQSIGTLATLIRIWQSASDNQKDVTPDQIEQAITSQQPALPDPSLRQMAQVIPQPILESVIETVTSAIERFADALKDPTNSGQDKKKEEQIAKATICRELDRIRRLNNSQLPSGVLEDYWISFGC